MSPHKKSDLLKQGTLELLVLRLLRAGPLNGWDIMQRIRVASGEVLSVTPGALYPALHRLEERGLVRAEWAASGNNRRARLYELTRAGGEATRGRARHVGALLGGRRGDPAGRVSGRVP